MAPAPSLRAAPLAIRPMDVIPPESFTHDLVVGDLSYLTLEQRYVYERGQAMGMRAAGLSGGAFMPGWVGSGGTEEWIANEQEESRIARKRRVRARRLVAGWGARN